MITEDQLVKAWETFDLWGLKVVKSPYLFESDGYFAGTDEQRLEEWRWAFSQDVGAIFCARGGYGLTRVIDEIDFSPLLEHSKWIIGFSDITAMHMALQRLDFASLHALMPVQFEYPGTDESLKSLREFIFTGKIEYNLSSKAIQTGQAKAPVVGGNLSLLAESLGTPTEINTKGCILFVEEIDEYLYKIDRMLNQLNRAGKFQDIAGLIIGDFSDLKDTAIPFGKSLQQIISRYINHPGIPVVSHIPMGHENLNLALPLNLPLTLTVNSETTSIIYDHTHHHQVS
jgi:muramoyltetrapeptide carboxypeptidase